MKFAITGIFEKLQRQSSTFIALPSCPFSKLASLSCLRNNCGARTERANRSVQTFAGTAFTMILPLQRDPKMSRHLPCRCGRIWARAGTPVSRFTGSSQREALKKGNGSATGDRWTPSTTQNPLGRAVHRDNVEFPEERWALGLSGHRQSTARIGICQRSGRLSPGKGVSGASARV